MDVVLLMVMSFIIGKVDLTGCVNHFFGSCLLLTFFKTKAFDFLCCEF